MKNKSENILLHFSKHPIILFLIVALNAPEEVSSLLLLFSTILILVFYHIQSKWLFIMQVLGILASISFIISEFNTIFSLDGGTNFLTTLVGLKALESHRKSDREIIFIAWALNASYSLYNQDLYATLLLVSSFVWGLFLIYDQTLKENNSNNKININFLKDPKIYLYSILSIITITILFTFFPRITFHLPSNSALISNSGFSNTLRPGTQDKLILSNQPVFSIKFKDKAPPLPTLYWIGAVLTETDGYFWYPKENTIKNNNKILEEQKKAQEYEYLVQLYTQSTKYLFHLDYPTSSPNISIPFYRPSNKSFRLFNEVTEKLNYVAVSTPSQISKGHPIQYDKPNNYIKASRKVIKLAEELSGDSTQATIQNIKKFFIEKKFIYTLEPGKTEFLDDFIFKTRRGFCSHYASALAILLRHAGLFSRVVIGFHGGDHNDVGDFYLLKGKDAHAWVEYLNEKNEWVRVDPVEWIMPARIQMGGQQFFSLSPNGETNPISAKLSLYGEVKISLKKYVDNFNRQWQAFLYNYDREAQRNLAKKVGLDLIKFFGLGLLSIILILSCVYVFMNCKNRSLPIQKEIEQIELLAKKLGLSRKNNQSFARFLESIAESRSSLNKEVSFTKQSVNEYNFSARPADKKEFLLLLKDFRKRLQKEVN